MDIEIFIVICSLVVICCMSLICIYVREVQSKDKIIKNGDTTEHRYKITCYHCGCEFVYTDSEETLHFMECESRVTCPCCKTRLKTDNRKRITNEEYINIIEKNRSNL